ncbi:MAG: glycosyltransferase family 2 protein [Bacteroidales bacterium]|jgi:glycosyltransferase involved in cell wall biosynthesis|nr:glycosyltransferase family 2 protein [Bacteroidales bacterium]
MPGDKLNIIIPLFNPHAGWENQFADHLSELEKKLKETEFTVIIVNDGSTIQINKMESIINRFNYVKYYSYPVNRGKGYAIRYGINASEADFYIYTDIDFPFGYQIIYQAYQILKTSKTNIVIGTRDASYFRILPLKRRIYSFLLKELNFFVTGFKIKDTQAGLKGLDNRAKKVLSGTQTNTFLFELEFLKNSLKQGLTYKFINVSCRQNIKFTNFRFRILLKETISLLKLLFN